MEFILFVQILLTFLHH